MVYICGWQQGGQAPASQPANSTPVEPAGVPIHRTGMWITHICHLKGYIAGRRGHTPGKGTRRQGLPIGHFQPPLSRRAAGRDRFGTWHTY
jgi:hypothetical protein